MEAVIVEAVSTPIVDLPDQFEDGFALRSQQRPPGLRRRGGGAVDGARPTRGRRGDIEWFEVNEDERL